MITLSLQISYTDPNGYAQPLPAYSNVPDPGILIPGHGWGALTGPDGSAKDAALGELQTFAADVARRVGFDAEQDVRVVLVGPDGAGDLTVVLADVTIARSAA